MRVNGNLESLALALSYVKEGSRVPSVLHSKPFLGTQKVGGIQLSVFQEPGGKVQHCHPSPPGFTPPLSQNPLKRILGLPL